MTTKGDCKVFASTTANATIDMEANFLVNINGIPQNDHAGFWLTNLDTVAANILWFRLDNVVATVAGDDCYVLRPGERVYVRKTSFISYIAAVATPGLLIMGDQSGLVYS